MRIICVSRGTFNGGRKFAELLAEKLGYDCISREQMVEAAVADGIQVGKLEMALTRSSRFSSSLALEKDRYLAFSTAYLCARAEGKGIVYHGRSGHLLLPGISHVLRVRVLADEEYRIRSAMQSMRLDRDQAIKYIKGVDEDRARWVHSIFGVDIDDASNYDVVLSLSQMSLENAATVIMNMAQLPDFQMTPASQKALIDLDLAARVRMTLARDERTHRAAVKVRADGGKVTVTYLPQDVAFVEAIPEVTKDLRGLKEIRVTMAMTNLLWIQEDFNSETQLYNQVVEIATKWNAAVELIRLEDSPQAEGASTARNGTAMTFPLQEYNGGIEEDHEGETEDGGLKETLDELSRIGRSGGGRVVHGGQRNLLAAVDKNTPYTLVVIGDLFKSKGHAAKVRATRDLRAFLSSRIKAPVVTTDELGSQYLFSKRDIPRVMVYLALCVLIYFLVFTHEEFVLAFLANAGWYSEAVSGTFLAYADWLPRVLVATVVVLFGPLVAYLYGNVAESFLKLIKME